MNRIKLIDFFNAISRSLTPTTYILYGDFSTNSLFFYCVRRWIEKNYKNIVVVDLDKTTIVDIVRNLETSLLGNSLLFWILVPTEQKSKGVQDLMPYFLAYKGPHTVVFCTISSITDYNGKHNTRINYTDIALHMDIDLLQYCTREGIIGHSLQLAAIDVIEQKLNQLSLDEVALLAEYLSVCGKQKKQFMQHWIDKIIPCEQSLFLISQHLFAKKTKDFFTHWVRVYNDYSVQFWITFWAEQMWRSAVYVKLMQQYNHVEAKKIVFRLPFSFIKRDWKHYSVNQLHDAHKKLYHIDCFAKRGGDGFGSLELFFAQFLTT